LLVSALGTVLVSGTLTQFSQRGPGVGMSRGAGDGVKGCCWPESGACLSSAGEVMNKVGVANSGGGMPKAVAWLDADARPTEVLYEEVSQFVGRF
jgi:hypothetical protein